MNVLALPRSTVDGGAVDDAVRRVLDQPRFSEARPGWFAQLRNDVQQWFLERLAAIFDSGAGSLVAWVLIGLAVLAAGLLVARLVSRLRPGGYDIATVAPVTEVGRSPSEWLADARRALGAEDPGEAVRCAYRAVVAGLAASGHLDEVPGRTVGEYRRQLEDAHPAEVAPFTTVAATFEEAWYAQRPVGRDAAARTVRTAAEVTGARA